MVWYRSENLRWANFPRCIFIFHYHSRKLNDDLNYYNFLIKNKLPRNFNEDSLILIWFSNMQFHTRKRFWLVYRFVTDQLYMNLIKLINDRVFLLHQIWIVNYHVKNLFKNSQLWKPKNWCFQKNSLFWHFNSRFVLKTTETPVFMFSLLIFFD